MIIVYIRRNGHMCYLIKYYCIVNLKIVVSQAKSLLKRLYKAEIVSVIENRAEFCNDKVSFWLDTYRCLLLASQLRKTVSGFKDVNLLRDTFLEHKRLELLQFV
jgi:hypothetical protein